MSDCLLTGYQQAAEVSLSDRSQDLGASLSLDSDHERSRDNCCSR